MKAKGFDQELGFITGEHAKAAEAYAELDVGVLRLPNGEQGVREYLSSCVLASQKSGRIPRLLFVGHLSVGDGAFCAVEVLTKQA